MFSVESLEACYGGIADRAAVCRTSTSFDLARNLTGDDVPELEHLRDVPRDGGASRRTCSAEPPPVCSLPLPDQRALRSFASFTERSRSPLAPPAHAATPTERSDADGAGQKLASGALRSISCRTRAVFYLAPERIMGQPCTDKVRTQANLQCCFGVTLIQAARTQREVSLRGSGDDEWLLLNFDSVQRFDKFRHAACMDVVALHFLLVFNYRACKFPS